MSIIRSASFGRSRLPEAAGAVASMRHYQCEIQAGRRCASPLKRRDLCCAMVNLTSTSRLAARRLVSQPKGVVLAEAAVLTLLVGAGDIATGAELSFSIFYLVPITLVAWSLGRAWAVANAGLAMFTWLGADFITENEYSSAFLPYWNALIRLGYFVLFALLFSRLHNALDQERSLSRRDPLTGIYNRRAFEELATTEVSRSSRYHHPMSLVVMDIDHFKQVNDRFGHDVGDTLLKEVATTLTSTLRATDIVARMGGDEFAIVIPETNHEQALVTLKKTRTALTQCMAANGWPVTFSIGVVSTAASPPELGELLIAADELMYQAKREGRDRICASSADDGTLPEGARPAQEV